MASRFLNVPKCDAFTFDSNEFTTLLSHRLYLPQPEWSLGLRCNCNRTIQGIREHPLLDERVHHAITNCPKEGVGIKLHQEMSNTLKDLANACGIRAQREEVNCFQSILNNVHFTDKEKRYRPDLSLFDMPGSHRKVILDISSTCPIPILGQQQFTFNEARETERAAKSRYSERELKFNEIAKACGCKFQAIIFETTGRMHSKSLTFIESILKKNSGFRDGSLLKSYWLTRISCSFQHQIARNILDKLHKHKGTRFISGNYENRPENYIHLIIFPAPTYFYL